MYLHFFDIPVYRLSEQRYYSERDSHIENVMYPPGDQWSEQARLLHKKEPQLEVAAKDHLNRAYGGIWRYNEIIGYIRLHFFGSQIRGEYFSVTTKRIVRTRRKLFEYQTHKLAVEIDLPRDANSTEIFTLVKQYVTDCQQELPNRYVDGSMLDMVGPFVDWRGLYLNRLVRSSRKEVT